ncbi:Transcriptional regulator, contains XRE-family HTH domain [Bacillus sp. OV166]|uniref:helix-turn-helix domain-containing protein n=1 Tax=Bacillus sp. OV166 TaxID=1882763 RepID=UPI000A2ACEC6|nr:helix-turn-helix transcriptional regulator [Bacillus sp. OV166]SMQ80269.1 Transcriptional regulator, contains XRE-family HTH domain [Bacillus sp. OV166]
MDIKLGTFIRYRRKEQKRTLKDLEKISGISFSQIGKIERGEHIPSKETISKIAKALFCDENELLHLAGYPIPSSKKLNDKIEPDLRYLALIKYNRTCQICGVKAPSKEIEVVLVDPNVPLYKITLDDLITLCIDCNYSRNKIIKEQGVEYDFLKNN